MGNLLDLANRLEGKLNKLEQRNSDRVVQVAEAILTDLVFVTPVDTSEALSNWQVGVGERPSSRRGPYFPGKKGSTQGQSAEAALAVGLAKLRGKQPGETVYISNLTSYITDLNRGSSAQAPAGFVERAVLLGKNAVRKARLK